MKNIALKQINKSTPSTDKYIKAALGRIAENNEVKPRITLDNKNIKTKPTQFPPKS